MNAGIGMFKGPNNDDVTFGLLSNNAWNANRMRAQLQGSYTSEEGNVGWRFRLRAQGTNMNAPFFHYINGWITGFDGVIKVYGGWLSNTELCGVDYMYGDDLLWEPGVVAVIQPIDLFSFGFGAMSTKGLYPYNSGADENFWDGTSWEGRALTIWAAAKVAVPDMLDFVVQSNIGKDNFLLYLSTAVYAIPGVDLDVGALFYNLNDYSDNGEMNIFTHIGLGMIENLGVDIFATFGKAGDSDLAMAFGAGAAWMGLGNIVPRFDVAFGKGFAPYSFKWDSHFDAFSYDSDQTYIAITPSVQFRARSNAYVEVGAVIGIDVGDAPAYTTIKPAAETGVSFGAFVDFRLTF